MPSPESLDSFLFQKPDKTRKKLHSHRLFAFNDITALGREKGSALDIKQLVSELKRQRRHLGQAIAALEALERRKTRERRIAVSRKPRVAPLPLRKTGTGGQVIPISAVIRSCQ